jgi:hypothetical protein
MVHRLLDLYRFLALAGGSFLLLLRNHDFWDAVLAVCFVELGVIGAGILPFGN